MTTTTRSKPARTPRQTRAEKARATRRALIDAAADVVGEYGYAEASIARITQRANVALGTFYNYFETRQALFDILLPELGQDLIAFVGQRVAGSRDTLDMEERGFRAFFEYLGLNPGFYRILNEAETMAPVAAPFDEDELETIVYLLMAARSYLTLRYGLEDGKLPEHVVTTYMKFVRGAFAGERSAP